MIVEIGRFVLHTACRDIARWNDTHPEAPLHIAVNLSARQVVDASLVDDVIAALNTTGLTPGRLTLEITETIVMEDHERSIARLHALKALGVRLAIDDFGTGYSSLAYLRLLPLDIVKIDKAFIDCVPQDIEGTVLVKAILRLAETLHLDAIAEGVTTAAQAASLKSYGCRLAQGFHFARPLPLDALVIHLERLRRAVAERAARPGGLAEQSVAQLGEIARDADQRVAKA
jgi:EAL domain-containing protein (putative c-di-GMP-specific phosphodiesterase class I)